MTDRSSPSTKNPAPNRGFSSKARELLNEPTDTSTKSQSSTHSYPAMAEEFDSLKDLPKKCEQSKKTLGDIGKTKSAGDLLKNTKKPANLIRTFQQLNIMRLPSVDSVTTSDHTKSLTKLTQINNPIFDDFTASPVSRQKAYEMK
uniref:Uncharacterized protein n=1 Tax=Panagrolaimus sp. PS1159 TaxID=55785 RepID=A0AC35FBN8_9BILA